jgi:hypothetical protein
MRSLAKTRSIKISLKKGLQATSERSFAAFRIFSRKKNRKMNVNTY